MHKIITATLHPLTPVPKHSIYQGDGMFEFETHKEPENIKEKYAEYNVETNTYYKDKTIKSKKLKSDDVVAEQDKIKPVIKKDVL